MAYVDLKNNQIYGCKKGSLSWWHEKGHIVYNESEWGSTKDFTRESMKTLTIVFTLLSHLHWIILILAFSYLIAWIFYASYEEIWCWRYAFKKTKEKK